MTDWDAIVELAGDRTLGSAETASRAAGLLEDVPSEDLPDAVETLLRGHPSMAPLWRLAHAVLTATDPAQAAEQFRRDVAGDVSASFALAPQLPARVLTISYSNSVAETLSQRKPRTVVCMVSEPGGEGLGMAGLVSAYSEVVVMDDDTAIRDVPAEAVVVGADAVTPTSIVNKVKTLELVSAAAGKGIPSYVAAGNAKLVPCELPVVQPFQAVPLHLFTGVALPGALLPPADVAERAASAPLLRALAMLIDRL
jgi:translation initiation factor 2B subunit (eIF-2B alpha/beta/delta family)